MIAKTAASGGPGLLPEVLAFSSSLPLDRALLREDLVGSLAHLTMLSRQGIVPRGAAAALRTQLIALWEAEAGGWLELPEEEDVHMAVEAALTHQLGETAGLLHTARSRNDQVALDLRLHVREQIARALEQLALLLEHLAKSAEVAGDVLLPAYTHRQRAQPVSLAYVLSAYGAMFARDVDALAFALQGSDVLPLGSGAIAGTSLPIDRETTRGLLGFRSVSLNAMDTVGDRDFALDFAYAASRSLLHASRVAADMVDFSSAEFGFVALDGAIACGSSMMPQKRNPDVFELIRGKSARGVGQLTQLLVTVKGLPGGYNRDLQEDRAPLLETGPLLAGVLAMLKLGLEHVRFRPERCLAALASDYTQATDLAEALAQKGVPFRTAYRAVGALVAKLQEQGLPLAQAPLALAQECHEAFDEAVLSAVDPVRAVARKTSAGSTGPASVAAQISAVKAAAERARALAAQVPRLDSLFQTLKEASL